MTSRTFFQLLNSFYPIVIVILALLFNYVSLTSITLSYVAYCLYIQITSKTELYYTKNEKNEAILSQCPSLSDNFKPHFLLPFAFGQIFVIGQAKPNVSQLKVVTENVNQYGAKLLHVTFEEATSIEDAPVIFFMPGMTGSIRDFYVINLAVEALNNGFNVVIFRMRLISEDFLLPDGGVYNQYEDIDQALDLIRKKYSGKIYGIGASYGANNMVHYLGNYNTKNRKIEAAVSISNPYDMLLCERLCEDTVYETLVTLLEKRNLRKIKPQIEKCINHNLDLEFLMNNDEMKAYDEYFTRKVLGYKSADDYYRNISCVSQIEKINIPLLFISSKDDMLTSAKAIPYDDIRLNPNVFLLATDHGGHMCFISNEKFTEIRQWHLKPVFEFIKSIRTLTEKKI